MSKDIDSTAALFLIAQANCAIDLPALSPEAFALLVRIHDALGRKILAEHERRCGVLFDEFVAARCKG